jgi:hypothetical protein
MRSDPMSPEAMSDRLVIRGRILRSVLKLDRPLRGDQRTTAPSYLSRIPPRESFWMIAKLSSIVIINLIANLTFLYHKPEKPAVTRID